MMPPLNMPGHIYQGRRQMTKNPVQIVRLAPGQYTFKTIERVIPGSFGIQSDGEGFRMVMKLGGPSAIMRFVRA